MTIEQVKKATDIANKIDASERLAVAYGNATKVKIGIPNKFGSHESEVTLLSEEIGDHIVAALKRRSRTCGLS